MAKKKNLEWRNYCEEALRTSVRSWVSELAQATSGLSNTIVFLNGPMGAGKSTFARILLETLAPGQLSKGSPTFPLVQEYRSPQGTAIYHIDLYRLKSESELEESGILSQIEEPGSLALVEWANQFPESFQFWLEPQKRVRGKSVWKVSISESGKPDLRHFILQNLDEKN